VYSREIDGRVLTFTTSGFTYKSQHVLYDMDTGGLWFHLWDSNDLTCISGPYAGRVLRAVADQHAGSWTIWKERHSNTKYLKPAR
jgi:hypothetical protein